MAYAFSVPNLMCGTCGFAFYNAHARPLFKDGTLDILCQNLDCPEFKILRHVKLPELPLIDGTGLSPSS